MGRPSKQVNIDPKRFAQLCQLKVRKKWLANYFNCSESLIEDFCRNQFGQTFSAFRDKQMMPGRVNLELKARQMAENNPRMMEFVLINYHGWSREPDRFDEEDQDFSLVFE